jgi:hypothetical protein
MPGEKCFDREREAIGIDRVIDWVGALPIAAHPGGSTQLVADTLSVDLESVWTTFWSLPAPRKAAPGGLKAA